MSVCVYFIIYPSFTFDIWYVVCVHALEWFRISLIVFFLCVCVRKCVLRFLCEHIYIYIYIYVHFYLCVYMIPILYNFRLNVSVKFFSFI